MQLFGSTKICNNHQLTPKYIEGEVNGNGKQSCNARRLAIKYALTQELKFPCMKKRVWRIHLQLEHEVPET
jgi:hypothetical protein